MLNTKFDVIVGNPPFDNGVSARNKKLWYKFSVHALKCANIVAFITPNNVVCDVGVNGEKLREYIHKNGFKFITAKDHSSCDYFSQVSVNTCHWIVTNYGTQPECDPIVIKKKKEVDVLLESICSKVTSYPDKLPIIMMNPIPRSEITDYGNEIYYSGNKLQHTNRSVEGNGVLKVVFPFSASYHKMFMTTKPTGMLNHVLIVSDEEEASKVINYCMSPLLRLVADNYKKTSGFTPFVKNCKIPDLRNIDFDNIYDVFGLTQEEIEHCKKLCKKYEV